MFCSRVGCVWFSGQVPATHHLINRKSISIMKPGVVLINTSRGGLLTLTLTLTLYPYPTLTPNPNPNP